MNLRLKIFKQKGTDFVYHIILMIHTLYYLYTFVKREFSEQGEINKIGMQNEICFCTLHNVNFVNSFYNAVYVASKLYRLVKEIKYNF